MSCVRPLWLHDKRILAPCGQCPACRAKRATSWSVRLAHEMAHHDSSCFVTLTIDDEHMPSNGSLEKRRLQLFFKRLRKSLGDRKIKYYACGEYGENTYRSHYHAIIFGLGLKDKQLIENAWSENGQLIGHVNIGLCEIRSIHYVTGYVRKKLEGKKDYEYKRLGFEPPFALQSLGLGLNFALENRKHLTDNLSVHLNGLQVSIPRYYVNKLGIDPQELRIDALKRSDEQTLELLARHSDKLNAAEVKSFTPPSDVSDDYYRLLSSKLRLGFAVKHDPRWNLHQLKIRLGLYAHEIRSLSSKKEREKTLKSSRQPNAF